MTSSHAYRGAGLEATLDLAHDLYNKRDAARIQRYHLMGDWHGGKAGRRFAPLPKAQQPPDYHGCVSGCLVVFDAKQTEDPDSWRLDNGYAHQFDRLRWWSEGRALAFFAVECVPRETLYLVRIHPLSPWPDVGFAILGISDWPHGVVVRKNGEGWYDWLLACQVREWLPSVL